MGDFPSGQRGQTVNLLATPSVVRIHHPPPRQKAQSKRTEPFVLVGHLRCRLLNFTERGYQSPLRLSPQKLGKFCDGMNVDSKGGSWQCAGGTLQPPWLSRRKANPPSPTKHSRTAYAVWLCFFVLVDSKGGTWQHAGGMLQPPWLSRRKANPPSPTPRKRHKKSGRSASRHALRTAFAPQSVPFP